MKKHHKGEWGAAQRHTHRNGVIAALSLHGQPRTLVEIMASTELPDNAAQHALTTLISEGIVESPWPGQFRLSTPIFEIAA